MNDSISPTPRTRYPAAEVEVSVALATFDGERWLGPLLASLADQETLPDELVVQDDRSSDGTFEILRRFASSAPFEVRIEQNPSRLGSTENFARALQRCRGRFIALADQDDVWYSAKLTRLVGELRADPTVTMVFSDADLIGEDGRPLDRRLWETRRIERTLRRRAVVPEELFAKRALTTGCTMALRRRAVAAALPFPGALAAPAAPMRHDRWLSMVSAAVGTVRSLPEPLLGFRVHPGQETGVLIGHHLTRALGRAGSGVIAGPLDLAADAHLARATQLDAAAARVEDLGDFEEANTLRTIADHHRLRARGGERVGDRVQWVLSGVRSGSYGRDLMGAGSAAADLVRAVRPTRHGQRP
jgi:hypothetical protein